MKEKAYLKSAIRHLGVGVPATRAIVKRAWKTHRLADDPKAVVAAVEELWAEPIYERRLAAVELLVLARAALTVRQLPLVERLVREAKTWALVDPLATEVAGAIADEKTLDRWARDPDFWIRRAALLAHLRGLREGGGDFARFARYADMMLDEKEFFIRKAIGWILRETGKKRPELVREYIEPRRERASGLTVREATRNLPARGDRSAAKVERARVRGEAPSKNGRRRRRGS